MQCNVLDEEDKIDVLYGAAEAGVARRVRQHLSACATCREEMAALEGTRETTEPLDAARRPTPTARTAAASLGPAPGRGGAPGRGRRPCPARLGDPLRGRPLLLPHGTERRRAPSPVARGAGRSPPARDRGPAGVPGDADVGRTGTAAGPMSRAGFGRARPGRANSSWPASTSSRRRSDSQRRLDMARVSAGLSYLDGKNGQHVARTSELMNSMLQASYKR